MFELDRTVTMLWAVEGPDLSDPAQLEASSVDCFFCARVFLFPFTMSGQPS